MLFASGQGATCPHCKTGVRLEPVTVDNSSGSTVSLIIRTNAQYGIRLALAGCPSCGKLILSVSGEFAPSHSEATRDILLWPDSPTRVVPAEVEARAPALAADFREAVSVYSKSKKASAALSRRCLQYILVHQAAAKKTTLADQIEEVLPTLPHELALNVDAVRHVGNFAAHPIKSTSTGEIVDVEEGEAEWLLDVLEGLFEHYFVAPTQAAVRREALNKKLASLGRPPLKAP